MGEETTWTDALASYQKEYLGFRELVRRAGYTSFGSGGLLTSHRREVYATTLFAKLAVTARTLLAICPNPASPKFDKAHMDFSSIAALSRVLIDTFVSLYHLGLEDCPDDESEVRMLLVFWRDFRVRAKLMRGIGNDEYAQEQEKFHSENLTGRLNANAFFASLPESQRKHLLHRNLLLHSAEEVLRRAGFNTDEHAGLYAYLSAHAHCDSVSFIFMGERNRGMGQLNTGDIAMTSVCLHYVGRFIALAADLMNGVVPGSEARARTLKRFDPLKNEFPLPPWRGKSIADFKTP